MFIEYFDIPTNKLTKAPAVTRNGKLRQRQLDELHSRALVEQERAVRLVAALSQASLSSDWFNLQCRSDAAMAWAAGQRRGA